MTIEDFINHSQGPFADGVMCFEDTIGSQNHCKYLIIAVMAGPNVNRMMCFSNGNHSRLFLWPSPGVHYKMLIFKNT